MATLLGPSRTSLGLALGAGTAKYLAQIRRVANWEYHALVGCCPL